MRGTAGGRCGFHFRQFDPVPVSLFGEEQLPVPGEFFVAGVACYQGIEARPVIDRLRPENTAQPLRFFLSRPECSGNLDRDVGVRQIDRKIGDLRNNEQTDVAVAEPVVEQVAHALRRLPRDQGRARSVRDLLKLIQVMADDEHRVSRVAFDQRFEVDRFQRIYRSQTVLFGFL